MNINTDYFIDLDTPKTEKQQIILMNTNTSIDDFLSGLSSGVINKIPTFAISKLGEIYQLYNPDLYSNLMDFDSINHVSISIALENHGPLLVFRDTGEYFNLLNQVLSGYNELMVLETEWRSFRYWDKYTEIQKTKLINLIHYLSNEYNIKKNFVGHNNKFDYATNHQGIINRSNYSKIYYDLNPSMDFEWLKNEIEQYEAK